MGDVGWGVVGWGWVGGWSGWVVYGRVEWGWGAEGLHKSSTGARNFLEGDHRPSKWGGLWGSFGLGGWNGWGGVK